MLIAPRSCLVPPSIEALSFVTGCALTPYTCFGAFFSWKQFIFNRTESKPEVYSQDSHPLFNVHEG